MIAVSFLASIFDHPAEVAAILAAPVIYVASLAVGRWLKHKHQVPLGVMFQLLCIALAAYVPLRVLHALQDRSGAATGSSEWWHAAGIRHFQPFVIMLSVVFGLQLLGRFYWQRWFSRQHGSEAPKLLQQVFGFAAFGVALAIVLKFTYGLQVDAFLAGSGIVAVVIGLAMQETLSNIISGIALHIEKPFKVGDWLIIDVHRAEVVEMNWRSTKLRTNDDVYLDIPNKTVVAGTITNLSYPTKAHSNRIRVGFDYDAPPNTVREVLKRSAANAPGVLADPPPKVFLRDFADSAVTYEIKYSLDDEGRYNDIEDAIRTNIWYEAKRAGMAIPYPIQTVHIERKQPASNKASATARELLPRQELFSPLDEAQKKWLTEHAKVLRFGRGEKIISQGSDGCSMFILVSGEADVVVHANEQDTVLASLRPGEAFGEMCLLTGEKRSATVLARTDCDLWEIDRALLQPLMRENSSLAGRMGELLARRKMETEGILAAQAPKQLAEEKRKEYTTTFSRKITSLFKI